MYVLSTYYITLPYRLRNRCCSFSRVKTVMIDYWIDDDDDADDDDETVDDDVP